MWMPEYLDQALATPGLIWLVFTISAAGVVRGFTGFGTALIFVPVAGIFLEPSRVVGVITVTGIFSTSLLLPRAWGQADRREVGVLIIAALITVPAGVWILGLSDRETIRWLVAIIAGVTLAALIMGWRYTGKMRLPGMLAIGAAAGLIGGLTGLTGPAVILFYLAGQASVQSVRANTILFLACLDVAIVVNLFLSGTLGAETAILALVLAVPYFGTTFIGQALFDPAYERLYRWAAYGVIGLALLSGLPIWE